MTVLSKETTAEAPPSSPEEVVRPAKRTTKKGSAVVFPKEISFRCAECGTRIISSEITLPVLLCSDHVGAV